MSITRINVAGILLGLLFTQSVMAAEYKIAVRAHHGMDVAAEQWQPTVDVLAKKLPQHTFILQPILDLKALTQRVGRGEFDFVLTNPSSYVEIQQRYGAKAIATLNNKRGNTAQSQFGSVIFTHASNTDIFSIKDLRGKTLMGVSPEGFGGWRVAWLEMLTQGFDPHRGLKELLFTKTNTQPEVVWAVRDGKADAGVVRTDRLERMEAAGKIDMRFFRIINNKDVENFPFFLSTRLYPEWAFVATKSVAAEQAEQVKKMLLEISSKSDAARAGKYVAWISPLDYSSVEHLMQQLEVGPYANKAGN